VSTVFSINFRREAYQRERAKAKRRAVSLGLWLAYFGALAIVLGLYALNVSSLARRTSMLERQVEQLRSRPAGADWRPGAPEASLLARSVGDPGRWRDRLDRLARLVPANARLTDVQYNPDNSSGTQSKLVLTGELRPSGGGDRMQQVLSFVAVLSRDSAFAAGYTNVRLVTTRASDSGEGAEFVIECR
jgi:hypothetical protein